MKVFIFTCLLALAAAEPQIYSPLLHGGYSYLGAHGLASPYIAAPLSPWALPLGAPLVPGHHVPADTPEVAAAKLEHFAAHAEALSRGKRAAAHAEAMSRGKRAAANPEAMSRGKRAAAYYGPPAPLNRDGTVAYTPEIQQANAVHNAAYQQEFQRLQAAASLAAAHPDRTSPPSADYNPSQNAQYSPQPQYDNGQYNPAWNNPAPSQPAYNPASYNPAPSQPAYNPAPYNAAPYNAAPYNANPSYNNYNPQPPAPLNSDGTAAHTAEYQAIAATHQQAYHQALSRTRRSAPLNPDGTVAPTPEVAAATAAHLAALHGASGHYAAPAYSAGHWAPAAASWAPAAASWAPTAGHWATPYSYAPYYHSAAPLNPDGTVAETAEVRAATAVHAAYVSKQLGDLSHQSALAAAAGPGEGEVPYSHYSGDYSGQYVAPYAGHYAGQYYAAAPLNADGSVAPTPEVAAATAAHLAAHAHARIGHAY